MSTSHEHTGQDQHATDHGAGVQPHAEAQAGDAGVTGRFNRREALGVMGLGAAGAMMLPSLANDANAQATRPAAQGGTGMAAYGAWDDKKQEYVLPPLPYPYDSLEPAIDEQTMRLHHDKHHQGYVNGLNSALAKLAEARQSGDFDLVKKLSRDAAFHGSGHFLHTVFWSNMAPQGQGGGGEPGGQLMRSINADFGSFDNFKGHFGAASKSVEGSGWGLLVYEPHADRLGVLQAEKHQNLTQWGVVPLLVIDVWEHAYYLKYQNNRGAYVDNFWNVVNWQNVNDRLLAARVGANV